MMPLVPARIHSSSRQTAHHITLAGLISCAQVGDPKPKGAMEFYLRPCGPKAFRETKPADKKSCSAAVLDFEVREDAADEDLEAIAMILNELFEEHVVRAVLGCEGLG